MQWIQVDSSMIEAIAWTGTETDGELMVRFKRTGAEWAYSVPVEVFREMQDAAESGGSVGKLFHANVKGSPDRKVS